MSFGKMSKTVRPDHYSLSQLHNELVEPGGDSINHKLIILQQCLQAPLQIYREQSESEVVQKLLGWLSGLIHPIGDILVSSASNKIEDLLFVSRTALECMHRLNAEFPSLHHVAPDVLLSIMAYTDAEDPWTTEVTQRMAEQLLGFYQKQILSHEFVIEHILLRFIRPLFSNSETPSVTSQGRKAISQTGKRPPHLRDLDAAQNPWKFREVSAMTILRWAIRNMDKNMFSKNWHLCIPPLLTLLDDPSTTVRLRGLHILGDLLQKMPSKVLRQTGLGEVFEDALLPTLLFLPELTPVEESVSLLESAYSALLSLGGVRYSAEEERSNKMRFLDRVMRKGVLQGFSHSGDNARIAELLTMEIATLVNGMGVHAVKFLKNIIPILSNILTDPFGPSRPSLLLAASKAIYTTIINCWPRMTESIHRVELVKALTLCWTAVNEEMMANNGARAPELEEVKKELHLAGTALFTSVMGTVDMMDEIKPLLKVDPKLSYLFIPDKDPNKVI